MFYNRTISKQEILENTPFKIEHHNGSDWIIAGEKSNLRIVTTYTNENGKVDVQSIRELENHGFKDVQVILDELITKFNLLFYTDNEWHQQIMENIEDMEPLVREAMRRNGGYEIEDFNKGIVKIPNR